MQTLISTNTRARKPTHEEIASAAYQLYVEQGSQHGHDVEDWLRAEQSLLERLDESTTILPSVPRQADNSAHNGIHALDRREHPFARDERGAPDREDIRRKTSPFRPASRQTRPGRQNNKHAARAEA